MLSERGRRNLNFLDKKRESMFLFVQKSFDDGAFMVSLKAVSEMEERMEERCCYIDILSTKGL